MFSTMLPVKQKGPSRSRHLVEQKLAVLLLSPAQLWVYVQELLDCTLLIAKTRDVSELLLQEQHQYCLVVCDKSLPEGRQHG